MLASSDLLATGIERLLPVLIVLLGGSLVPPSHLGTHESCELFLSSHPGFILFVRVKLLNFVSLLSVLLMHSH